MSAKRENNVVVGVRIRPRNNKEIESEMPVCFTPSADQKNVQELGEEGEVVKLWSYDHVFGPTLSNKFIFDEVGCPLVEAAMDGYNTVLFMYGQTSSGKTFTLFGDNNVSGVVNYAMEHVHNRIKISMDTEYVIKLTYAELYNEELRDLLSPTPNENLKIVDDPQLGPLIQNITEANFTTASDVKHLLEEGEKSRHFGVTNMNAHSSRSHVLVRLSIESRKVATRPSNPLRLSWGRDKPQCVSTLNLVDLAGSERAAKSGTSGQSLKEGSFINKSLLTLGTVISNLSEGKTGQHIPYRNSKLTRLLATALGGNARTAMITCISPASGNVMESLSTLRFASRAKRIVNMVQKNVILDAKTLASKLALQNAEIDQLRQQLEQSRLLGFVPDDPEQGESLKDRAISASRNWRSLRFLISNSSKVISSLRGAGLTVIAKKVQHDLRDAVAGTKDLADIIAEHTAIINTHLPHETKLVHRLHQLHRENDGDSIVGEHHDEVSELDDASVDGDMFEMGNYDSEELREKMEQSQLNGEDFRVVAIRRIHQLEHEAGEISRKEKKARSTMDELNIMLIEREEQIKLLRSSENSHLKTIDDLKVSLDNEQNKFAQTSQESVMRINELVIQLSDKDAELVEKDQMLMKKDAEIDKLRIATEKLTKDLTHSLQSKRAIEEETMRARNEMRTQMDRLRANMHDLLVQGGEENKVVESHNAELQREIDSLQDTLLEVNQSKERLEMEVQRLMHDRESFREEEKARIEQIQAARNETSLVSQRLRDARIEITQLASQLQVSEQNNSRLLSQVSEEIKNKDDAIEAKEKEFKQLKAQLESNCLEIKLQMDMQEAELLSAREEIQFKVTTIHKLEQSLANDTSRLEKKLAQQMRLNEDLVLDANTNLLQVNALVAKHAEEVKGLRSKIRELQGVVDSITKYVDEQQQDIYEASALTEKNLINRVDSFYVEKHLDDISIPSPYSQYNIISTPRHFRERADTPTSLGDDLDSVYQFQNLDMVNNVDSAPKSNRSSLASPFRRSPRASLTVGFSPHTTLTFDPSKESNSLENKFDGPVLSEFDSIIADSVDRFEKLKQGMSLLTLSLTHACKIEKVQRSYMLSQYSSILDEKILTEISSEELADRLQYLVESKDNLSKAVEHLKRKETAVDEKLVKLEDDHKKLLNDYHQHLQSEQLAMATASRFEQSYLDCKVFSDKIRQDNKNYINANTDLKVFNQQLQNRIDELEEDVSVCGSRIGLLEQELGVLQVERDELMKRFLRRDVKTGLIIDSPTSSPISNSAGRKTFDRSYESIISLSESPSGEGKKFRSISGNNTSHVLDSPYFSSHAKLH